jgi:hypothetical protein
LAVVSGPIPVASTNGKALLRDAQDAAMAEPEGSPAALLLEGIVLRLQADLRWLEACEAAWTKPTSKRRRS